MKNNRIIGLIGARGGSKGIPNKNVAVVGGYPLIVYSITVSQMSKYIERTIVSTDSPDIRHIASISKAEVPFLRPPEYAKDDSIDYDYIKHALDWLKETEDYVPTLIVHLRPTTPLRDVSVVDTAIAKFLQCPEATSMRSVELLRESPYKIFLKDDDYLMPFVQTREGEFYNLPRQHFPKAYRPNGYVDILRPSVIAKGSLHGDKIMPFDTKRVIELDSEEDFEDLQRYYKESSTWSLLENNC